jgi:hypothetical protein
MLWSPFFLGCIEVQQLVNIFGHNWLPSNPRLPLLNSSQKDLAHEVSQQSWHWVGLSNPSSKSGSPQVSQ